MKNTIKSIKIFGLILFSVLALLIQADFAFAAPSCVGKAMTFEEYKWFKAHGQVSTTLSVNDEAGKAVAHINNNTDCSMPVGLDTFRMYDNILQNQTKFDGVHIVIPPHTQGFKLKANIPECMVQIDTYVGAGWETPNNLTAWLIANQVSGTGLHNVSGNYCTRQPPLVVSCSSNPSSVSQNGVITWSASATGGNGNYSYSWSGTDGLSGSSQTLNKSYSNVGAKNALVTVTSDNKTKTASCSASVTENVVPLSVSCTPSSSSIRRNSSVYWNASVSGGRGSYLYSWSGTDGLSGSGSNVYKSYSNTGTKTATVTVYSETQSVSATCDLNVYDDYIPTSSLEGSCSAVPYNAQVGTNVSWSASAYGGSGSYYYYWSGTDGLYGNGQYVSKSYYSPGYKTATVTISSGGQSITRNCYTNVGQVLAYTETNNLPTLTSVYLSEVPYTGIGDKLQLLAFLSALIGFSALLAYLLLRKKQVVGVAVEDDEEEVLSVAVKHGDAMTEKFVCNRIISDKQAFENIEDIALNNKSVLSTGAIESIVKAARMNCSDEKELAHKVIDSCRQNKGQNNDEWCVIGEEDVSKTI